MSNSELSFRVTGDAYQKVRQYRLRMDQRVICSQIEHRGRAVVIRFQGQRGFRQLTEPPEMGAAVPWYGNVGTGYQYSLHPEAEGCRLKVENIASGRSLFCHDILPPLELHIQEAPLLKLSTNGGQKGVARFAGYACSDDETGGELIFSITPDLYPLSADWPRYGEPLAQYEYVFSPLTVGNLVCVRHVSSGEVIDLTKDIEW